MLYRGSLVRGSSRLLRQARKAKAATPTTTSSSSNAASASTTSTTCAMPNVRVFRPVARSSSRSASTSTASTTTSNSHLGPSLLPQQHSRKLEKLSVRPRYSTSSVLRQFATTANASTKRSEAAAAAPPGEAVNGMCEKTSHLLQFCLPLSLSFVHEDYSQRRPLFATLTQFVRSLSHYLSFVS